MRCAIYKDVTLAANGGYSSTAKHSATSSFLAPRLGQFIPQNPHLCVKRNRPILNPTSQYTATNPPSIAILTRASISYSLSKPTRTPVPSRPLPTTSPKVLLAHLESLRKPIMHRVFPGPLPRYLLRVNNGDTIQVKPLRINQYNESTKHAIITPPYYHAPYCHRSYYHGPYCHLS